MSADGVAPEQAYAIDLEARLTLRHAGAAEVVFEARRDLTSASSLTTSQWSADDGIAVHDALDRGLQGLAEQLLADLLPDRGSTRGAQAPPSPQPGVLAPGDAGLRDETATASRR